MKQIIIFLLLSITLIFVFVCSKNKPTQPPYRDDPGYYYPRQKDYSWRYINLGGGAECATIVDSFDLAILGTNTRDGYLGFDRFRSDNNDTNFIYQKADTLFAEMLGPGVPPPPYNMFKILVGPVKENTSWSDSNFDYSIQGFENVTLTINGVIFKKCAKIIKTNRNPTKHNVIYEWWAPSYGKAKEMEEEPSGDCVRAEELRSFSKSGVFP
jgi:hypothetical protein